MNLFVVSGGSYKTFYFNYLKNIKNCDLLVINFNVLDVVCFNNLADIYAELITISKKLNCVVVAGVKRLGNLEIGKIVLMSEGEKIKKERARKGLKVNIKGKVFIVGEAGGLYEKDNKIILGENKMLINEHACSSKRFYLFCDNKGVSFVLNKKLNRKFNKCVKIVLK